MVYQIILDDGELLGKYSDKKKPCNVAKAIMRVIHTKTGETEKEISFYNTKTERQYRYKCKLVELKPTQVEVNNTKKVILVRYNFSCERI